MAKLTDEQKAANKEASKERARAFSARRRQYDAEMAAANAAAEELPMYAALVGARHALECAIAARNDAVSDIDKEIARLQALREEVRKQHGLAIDSAKAERDVAVQANQAATEKLTAVVKERFPDMVGVFLQSQWQRPDGV